MPETFLVRRRIRRVLACLFAPAAVIPLIFLGDSGYLRSPEHWDKFWLDELLYWTIVSYLGSAVGAPLVVLTMKLRRSQPSIRGVWGWFVLFCSTIAAIVSTPLSDVRFIGVLMGTLTAIGSSAVALAYGAIAGLPWRAGREPRPLPPDANHREIHEMR